MKRFRMIAGPNGSGKTTLARRLQRDYAVNFHLMLNADDIFAEVARTHAYAPALEVEGAELEAYAAQSSYPEAVKAAFACGDVCVRDGCVRFTHAEAVNSYAVALVTNFLQEAALRQGVSFSQETVFSHPSKLEVLRRARTLGYRTYLYFVATDSPEVNVLRVANRVKLGGHAVPEDRIRSRYARALAQLPAAFAHLSRAYFFDNGGETMRYLGAWNAEDGLMPSEPEAAWPSWFARSVVGLPRVVRKNGPSGEEILLAASADVAGRAAAEEARAAGLPEAKIGTSL